MQIMFSFDLNLHFVDSIWASISYLLCLDNSGQFIICMLRFLMMFWIYQISTSFRFVLLSLLTFKTPAWLFWLCRHNSYFFYPQRLTFLALVYFFSILINSLSVSLFLYSNRQVQYLFLIFFSTVPLLPFI